RFGVLGSAGTDPRAQRGHPEYPRYLCATGNRQNGISHKRNPIMNKILLIIKREYLCRVKQKSFLLVTFLVPLFLIGIYALTIYLTAKSFENNQATVYVVDQSGLFEGKVENTGEITFIEGSDDVTAEKERILTEDGKNFLLIIPPD